MYRCCYYTCTSCDSLLWLWCMNWNKRVCSERRKSHFRGSRFQNFPGDFKISPRAPLQMRGLMYASVSSGAGWDGQFTDLSAKCNCCGRRWSPLYHPLVSVKYTVLRFSNNVRALAICVEMWTSWLLQYLLNTYIFVWQIYKSIHIQNRSILY
jgi:hypothetical protein